MRYWPVDIVYMWFDSQRVHPVPERSLLPGFTLIRNKKQPEQMRISPGERVCKRETHLPSTFQSWFSGLVRAGYLLKSVATKAMLSFAFPLTTSVAVTNCRQPKRSACFSIHSALFVRSFSWWHAHTQHKITHLYFALKHCEGKLVCWHYY